MTHSIKKRLKIIAIIGIVGILIAFRNELTDIIGLINESAIEFTYTIYHQDYDDITHLMINFGDEGSMVGYKSDKNGLLIRFNTRFLTGTIIEYNEHSIIIGHENEYGTWETVLLTDENSVFLLNSQLVSRIPIEMDVVGRYTFTRDAGFLDFNSSSNIFRTILSSGHSNIKINSFDENFLSDDGRYYIQIGSDTVIVYQDGTIFKNKYCELIDRELIILFNGVGLVYPFPNQVHPYKIIVIS